MAMPSRTHRGHLPLWYGPIGGCAQPASAQSGSSLPLSARIVQRVRLVARGPWRALLRQQLIGAVPVVRRRVLLVVPDPRLIEVIEIFERIRLVGPAATIDRRQRTIPVAAAITGQHLDGEVAQPLETFGLRDILAAGDGVDHLRLLL